jgi:F-type H+-transporting ATPase subunit c
MIGAGLVSFGMAGAAIGIGLIFAALLQSVARNPAMSKTLFGYGIIGAALAELMGLTCILIGLVFAFSK